MYFSLFLIILSSVQGISCSRSNVTVDDTCDLCTTSWLRRKRAQAEYTRWRANQETSEFIVKVLDDDLPTVRTQKIAAINIQPLSKNDKKIIIGGAIVAPTTIATTLTEPIVYTRFILPTTIPEAHEKTNLRSTQNKKIALPGVVKHVHRDESPPSGPQFLSRTRGSLTRQYAPVAPVSFNRGPTLAPLAPKSIERFMYKTPYRTPTRTSPLPDALKPSRTTSNTFMNIFLVDKNDSTEDQMLVSHSSLADIVQPHRTLSFHEYDDSLGRSTKDNPVNWRRNQNDPNYKKDEESDLSYNMIFVNNENMKKNTNGDTKRPEINNDRDNDQYEIFSTDLDNSKNLNESLEDTEQSDNSTDFYVEDKNDLENETLKHVTQKPSMIEVTRTTKTIHKKRRETCSMVKLRQLNFNSPRTLPEIVTQLRQWAETSPVAKWVDITNGNFTTMENPIYMMIVDDPSSGQIVSAKKTVLVIAGSQGRDHHAVAAAMYLLYQLIERSEAHSSILTKYRFWIIPVFNPDGYDYSLTFPHRRDWTKNLRQKWESCKGRESCEACEAFGLRCTIQSCYGVNLDRNFEYQWIPTDELRSEHPCGSLYAGERQLSEPETQALTHFLTERRTSLFIFIAFKEGDVLGILYPYSHTRKRRAFDNVYRQRASRAASAAYSIVGRPYVAGQTSEFLPLYAGGIEDWMDGHLGIDNTYTVMMFRPTDSYNSKLITEHVVHEAYAATDTLLLQSAEPFTPATQTLVTSSSTISSSRSPLLVVATILLTIGFK